MRHDIDSCDQDDEDQDDACSMDWLWRWRASRGFEAKDHAMVKLEQDLAPMDLCNGEEQVKSRSMDRDGHVMI
jgi:hypothetical protein